MKKAPCITNRSIKTKEVINLAPKLLERALEGKRRKFKKKLSYG